jgi:hypothetical protein
MNDKKMLAVIKVIAFIIAFAVAWQVSKSGYNFIEVIFFGAIAFTGAFISLAMALCERKHSEDDLKKRNLYSEDIPEEYQS